LLVKISITFFNQLVFDLLQFTKFLCRTEPFSVLDRAHVAFNGLITKVDFSSQTETFNKAPLSLIIRCRGLEWQLSSLSQVCNSVTFALSTVKSLDFGPYISEPHFLPLIQDDMDKTQWLELLHPFTNVKDLHLPRKVPTWIAPAMEEVTGERVTEVLPVLQNIFLDDELFGEPEPVPKAISEFVAARQLSGCPVAIHRRRRDWKKSGTWVVIETITP
jgi:hypothetical protein